MLRWVLLCNYCSFYHYQLPKTSELGRAINAHSTVAIYFRDHYLCFRVCSFAELSSAFITPAPEGAAVVYINIFHHLPSELHHTSMEHARLVCTHLYIDTHPVEGWVPLVPFFSNGLLYMVSLLLSLTPSFSVKETLMNFGYTYAPNLIHQGASVITEISSTRDDKNSASSKIEMESFMEGLIPRHCKRVKNYTK
jgi:hypothetical protein